MHWQEKVQGKSLAASKEFLCGVQGASRKQHLTRRKSFE